MKVKQGLRIIPILFKSKSGSISKIDHRFIYYGKYNNQVVVIYLIRKSTYAKHLKKQVTLRLGIDVIDYFRKLAEETGVPYQNLINLYLQDCVHSQKKLRLKWAP